MSEPGQDSPPIHVHEFIVWAANGDPHAEHFLRAFYQWSQVLDDLVDRDKPVAHRDVAMHQVNFLSALMLNPFVQQHRVSLFGLLVSAAARWHDSDVWRQGRNRRLRDAAKAVACGDTDVAMHVAWLTHGNTAFWQQSAQWRDADGTVDTE